MIEDLRPLLAVLVSIAAIPAIVASRRHPNLRETWTLLAAFIKAGLVLSLTPAVVAGKELGCTLWEVSPGVQLALRVDTLGYLFAVLASVLWIVTSCYSIGYVRGVGEHKQTRYFASFALSLSSTIGLAFAAHLLTF